MHATHGDTASVVAVIKRGDKHLRCALQVLRLRNYLHYLVEQIVDVVCRLLVVGTHPSVLGGAIDHREVELVLTGVEVAHEVEHHLVDLLGAAVGLVNLVDHHDRLQSYLQCLLQHETRLRHGAFESVDQEQAAVGHVEHALNLAAEVGVARSVKDVDLYSFPVYRDVLRKNRYPSLTLQVVGVEHLAAFILSISEKLSGEHHLVDQRGFTMVDVRNHCNVTNVLHRFYLKINANLIVLWVQNYKKNISKHC